MINKVEYCTKNINKNWNENEQLCFLLIENVGRIHVVVILQPYEKQGKIVNNMKRETRKLIEKNNSNDIFNVIL